MLLLSIGIFAITMSEDLESNVWLWKEPDRRWKDDVIAFIKNVDTQSVDKDIVLLHCIDVEGFDESIPLANYILNLSQRFNVFPNERVMYLNPKDLFQAIELCLERNIKTKDSSPEIEILDEDVVQSHKTYIKQFQRNEDDEPDQVVLHLKKFMEENNCVDLWMINDKLLSLESKKEIVELLSNFKFLILGYPSAEILKNIIYFMVSQKVVFNVTVETPLDISLQGSPSCHSPKSSSQKVDVTSELIPIEDITVDTESNSTLRPATEEYVEDVIVAFLSLLVNSRNELSLSKAMISPIIDLSHEAFTELKHLAHEKEMPMCQTAISYVTRLKLGGKGYAPPTDCPMLPHLKSLELFVDTLNQMQTVIEEDLKPISAIKRLINILKKKLLKCGSEKLKPSAIEAASENLKAAAGKVINIMKSKQCNNDNTQVCQEGLDVLHYFVNYINCTCFTFDPKKILIEKHSKRTPINLPPLLGYFRSPEEEFSCDASVVSEDSILSNDASHLSLQQPVSYFHHSDNSSMSVSVACVDSQTPAKTTFRGCVNDDNSTITTKFPVVEKKKLHKGRKRSILGDLSNENISDCENDARKKQKINSVVGKKVVGLKDATNRTEVKLKDVINETKEGKLKGLANGTKEVKLKVTENNSKQALKEASAEVKGVVKLKDSKNKSACKCKHELKMKPKGGKKFKLIEGQGKITSFFTMK